MGLGVVDGLVAGQGEVADRGDAGEVRGEVGDAHLEADLVVALAGGAVADDRRAVLARRRHQVLDDDRPGERGHQRVAVHVERVGLQGGQAVVVGELLAGVHDLGLDRPAGQGALADDLEVLTVLADVDRARDHLGPGLLGDPSDRHGRVQPTRVGQYDALSHESLQFSSCAVPARLGSVYAYAYALPTPTRRRSHAG